MTTNTTEPDLNQLDLYEAATVQADIDLAHITKGQCTPWLDSSGRVPTPGNRSPTGMGIPRVGSVRESSPSTTKVWGLIAFRGALTRIFRGIPM